MDRIPFVAGNWKMYTNPRSGVVLVQALEDRIEDVEGVQIAVAPPATGLYPVSIVIENDDTAIQLAAQDCFWENEGAFTGEISPTMLANMAVAWVILGHSERRQYFGETDESVNKKVHAVLAAGMKPIVCVGESLAQREAGETDDVVRAQVKAGCAGLTAEQAAELVVAYEPVWAIGTGRTPTPEEANDVARAIRATIGALYGPPAAMGMRVQYGGSVKPENARLFFSEPDIDGALVGGAALDADSFAAIIKAAAAS
jgi:triosephosphate isomerase